ncbi:MAG: hypothetical protein AW08_03675 [Candidatus Accumulibacter adjunctus]|uniref:DUF3396 domain-containing protein n=1 Tax=Candidatus Accumulibacter adjunctus TaxID=1454001 RepID=A0A011MPL7_9PROT|nr:MAG: hypothetical protein AW08_03675 [Candidatus Accumulibacter adjunctus]
MPTLIPKVLKTDDETVLLRDGITAAFFLPPPLEATAAALQNAFDRYLAHVGLATLRWASVGAHAEEFRPLNAKSIERCRAMLSVEAARGRKLTAFRLLDGRTDGDAPEHGVSVIGNPIDAEEPLESNLLEFYFPSTTISTPESADVFVSLLLQLSEHLPIRYAYASPALHWAEVAESEGLLAARRVAARYPGFDVSFNEVTRSDLGANTRGARWLTWLGPELVGRVGGFDRISMLAAADIHAVKLDRGVLLRAGRVPEIGDCNRGIDTPHLRALAAFLEPVTLFEEPALLHTAFADEEPTRLREWERRFLGDSR